MTCLLTIAVEMSNRSAAATKLPESTTCRKTLMLVRVSMRSALNGCATSLASPLDDAHPPHRVAIRRSESAGPVLRERNRRRRRRSSFMSIPLCGYSPNEGAGERYWEGDDPASRQEGIWD